MTDENGKSAAPAPASARGKSEPLGDANSEIAARLKAFYEDVESQPIPDMLLDLLEKLDAAEAAAGPKR